MLEMSGEWWFYLGRKAFRNIPIQSASDRKFPDEM